MKKLLACTMLLAFIGLAADDAQAQFCFNFSGFCDGIQVDDITDGNITAQWFYWDCLNTVPMTSGIAPSACGSAGRQPRPSCSIH